MLFKQLKHWFRSRRDQPAQVPAPPPPVQDASFETIRCTGNYDSWEAAAKDSTGYDAASILEMTKTALLKVKNGEAVYERDSVLFDKIHHSFPVLAGLLRAAMACEGRLCVLDFGGALGSSYFQCRKFLGVLHQIQWLIVEQPAHVACGSRHFASEQLQFFPTVEACMGSHQPNVMLLSGVLAFMPLPHVALGDLLKHRIRHVIIDRTAFLHSDRDRLTVQHVPAAIYKASYPAWFLSESRLRAVFASSGYEMVADFPCLTDDHSPDGESSYFKGFIFEWRGSPDRKESPLDN